jgi:hypothetical protein
MEDGGDANTISLVMKTDAVVADAQPELRRFDVPESLDVAFAVFQITGQRVKNAESSFAVNGTELGFGLVVPDNVLAHAY